MVSLSDMIDKEIFSSRDDQELIVNYLQGQDEALAYLIERHLHPVYRFVFGLVGEQKTAEDLTQDIFVKVWKKIKTYNKKYSFKTWLYTIARNTVFDHFRQTKEIPFSDFEDEVGDNPLIDSLIDESPLVEQVLSKMEDIASFNKILMEIPALYREVLLLKYNNDMSIGEISALLKRPFETVKSQERRGLLHLKKILSRIY